MSGGRNAGPHQGPHQGPAPASAGPPPSLAGAALILVHGRGATAESILALGDEVVRAGGVPGRGRIARIAPRAAGHAWYPYSFLAPIERNEPGLSSGIAAIEDLVAALEADGVPPERVVVAGFSQGACLALEHAARHPRRYAGVAALTGGLIGPPGTVWDSAGRDHPGSLAGTPVFLGSGDPDPHVPWERVEESAEVLRRMGAEVTLRRYPGMPHTVNREEIEALGAMVDAALAAVPAPAGETSAGERAGREAADG